MCYVMHWDVSIRPFHGPDYGCGSDPFGMEVFVSQPSLVSPASSARSEAPSSFTGADEREQKW